MPVISFLHNLSDDDDDDAIDGKRRPTQRGEKVEQTLETARLFTATESFLYSIACFISFSQPSADEYIIAITNGHLTGQKMTYFLSANCQEVV